MQYIQGTVSQAKECKEVFRENYQTYCSYLSQFTSGTLNGIRHKIRILPVSRDTYINL